MRTRDDFDVETVRWHIDKRDDPAAWEALARIVARVVSLTEATVEMHTAGALILRYIDHGDLSGQGFDALYLRFVAALDSIKPGAAVGEGTPEVRHSNGCAINADPADGFGYCTCGAGHTDPTPPTDVRCVKHDCVYHDADDPTCLHNWCVTVTPPDPTPPTCPTCGSEDKGLCRLMDNGTYCNAPAIDLWHTDPTGTGRETRGEV